MSAHDSQQDNASVSRTHGTTSPDITQINFSSKYNIKESQNPPAKRSKKKSPPKMRVGVGSPNRKNNAASGQKKQQNRLTQSIDGRIAIEQLPYNGNRSGLGVNAGGRNSQLSSSQMESSKSKNIQELIHKGDVDYAAWRKRKAEREDKLASSNVGISGIKQQRAKRSFKTKRFDYIDPVDGGNNRALRDIPMANLHQMKFHEMKVEREPFIQVDKMAK